MVPIIKEKKLLGFVNLLNKSSLLVDSGNEEWSQIQVKLLSMLIT